MNAKTKERPILFSGEMVRAILDGTKTQTRRIVKPQSLFKGKEEILRRWPDQKGSPYGEVGDRLWVRETFLPCTGTGDVHPVSIADAKYVCFRDGAQKYRKGHYFPWSLDIKPSSWPAGAKWRPSIHLPRWASRIMLEITDVRVQRLQEISEEDAKAEGTDGVTGCKCGRRGEKLAWCGTCKGMCFWSLWDQINKHEFWFEHNPWVWAISFRRITP